MGTILVLDGQTRPQSLLGTTEGQTGEPVFSTTVLFLEMFTDFEKFSALVATRDLAEPVHPDSCANTS